MQFQVESVVPPSLQTHQIRQMDDNASAASLLAVQKQYLGDLVRTLLCATRPIPAARAFLDRRWNVRAAISMSSPFARGPNCQPVYQAPLMSIITLLLLPLVGMEMGRVWVAGDKHTLVICATECVPVSWQFDVFHQFESRASESS